MTQQISLQDAIDLVSRMKENPVTGLPVSETFNAEIINAILSIPGCVSLRIYPGMKTDGSIVFVLSGADSDNNDLTDILGEDGFRCPPACPTQSSLYL